MVAFSLMHIASGSRLANMDFLDATPADGNHGEEVLDGGFVDWRTGAPLDSRLGTVLLGWKLCDILLDKVVAMW